MYEKSTYVQNIDEECPYCDKSLKVEIHKSIDNSHPTLYNVYCANPLCRVHPSTSPLPARKANDEVRAWHYIQELQENYCVAGLQEDDDGYYG